MPGYGSNCSELAKPKGDWRADRATRDAKHAQASEIENRKVKRRSGGQCEVRIGGQRCKRRAVHIHHRFGGHGRRDIGPSMLAENKAHLCMSDHVDEHLKRIRPVSWDEGDWASTVVWERS